MKNNNISIIQKEFKCTCPNNYFYKSNNISKPTYKVIQEKNGRIWLVANKSNLADHIYVAAHPDENKKGYRGFRGFGGSTLTFHLENGTTLSLQGPWKSNSDSLFQSTGYDIRDQHLTYGAVGLGRIYKNNICYLLDIIYCDHQPVIGIFDRIKIIAQEYANKLQQTIYYFNQSNGGSSCGPVDP